MTITKLQVLFARFMLILSLAFMAAPLAGCSENKLPSISMPTGSGTAATGQYNVTSAIERNWYAANNRGEFLACWVIILAVPWAIFFGISGWMFGKREKPCEIISLVAGTALMYRWASSMDLEPWLLICWVVPTIIYIFLKGEKKKFRTYAVFTGAYMGWSVWMIGKAIMSAFTYHPILMIAAILALCTVFSANLGGEDKKDAHGDGHGH